MPKISVVIVSREKIDLLGKAIDSVIDQSLSGKDYEIIIVDDGSDKDNYEKLILEKKKKFPNIKVVKQGKKSLAAGRNLGTREAKSEIIAFTDNDCLVDKNWLKEILDAFSEKEVIGVEGKIVTDTPRGLFTNAPENLSGKKFIGANSAYQKEIIEKAGYYNEGMKFWREDSEFAFRAMQFGKIKFAEKTIVYHPLRKDPPESVFRYLFFLRNEWICFFKQPLKYLRYFRDEVVRDILKIIVFYATTFGIIFGILINNPLFSLFFIILISALGFILFYISEHKKQIFSAPLKEKLLFGFYTWIKYLAYPIFAVYGFADALLFLLAEKVRK
ncbi:MAG TPA: glycosyltransferase [archaeon]|nr:glycosyltransferase [archaeon]